MRKNLVLLFAAATVMLAGCKSTPKTTVPTFSEDATTPVAIEYLNDRASRMIRPEKTDGPFTLLLTRDQILTAAKAATQRQMAVVTLCRYANNESRDAEMQRWIQELGGMGYQRVVFLQANDSQRLNGMVIIRDWRRS